MTELIAHNGRQYHVIEKGREDLDVSDQHKII